MILIYVVLYSPSYAGILEACPAFSDKHGYPIKAFQYPDQSQSSPMLIADGGLLQDINIVIIDDVNEEHLLPSPFGVATLSPAFSYRFNPILVCLYSKNITNQEAKKASQFSDVNSKIIKLKADYQELLLSLDSVDKTNISKQLRNILFANIEKSTSNFEPTLLFTLLVRAIRIELQDYNVPQAENLLTQLFELNQLMFQQDVNRQFIYHLLKAENALISNNVALSETHLSILKTIFHEGQNKLLHTFRVDYFDLLGHYYLTRNKVEKNNQKEYLRSALESEYTALRYVQDIPGSNKKIRIHNNIAWIHRLLGNLQSSLRNYLIAQNYLEENATQILAMYNAKNIAEVYLALGHYNYASVFFQQAIELGEKTQSLFWTIKNRCQLAIAQNALGEILTAQENALKCMQTLETMIAGENNPVYINTLVQFLTEFEFVEERQKKIDQLIKLRTSEIIEPRVLAKWHIFEASKTKDLKKKKRLYNRALEESHLSEDLGLKTQVAIKMAYLHRNSNEQEKLESINYALNNVIELNAEESFSETGQHWLNEVNSFLSYALEYFAEEKLVKELYNFQRKLRVVTTSFSQQLELSETVKSQMDELSRLSINIITSPTQENKIEFAKRRSRLVLDSLFSEQDLTKGELELYKLSQISDDSHFEEALLSQDQNGAPVSIVSFIQGEKNYWGLFVHEDTIDLVRIGDVSTIDRQIFNIYTSLKNSRNLVHTPEQSGHRFRHYPDTLSVLIRTPIPG